ncbi:hypothetical protein GCM10023205_47110 [Yinghuangia aomiensis]|uniref:Transposase n=1 Tax=Yinghuangia aomiensis TaxID=676205 RepID=A0ABP9HPG7_9ACTN
MVPGNSTRLPRTVVRRACSMERLLSAELSRYPERATAWGGTPNPVNHRKKPDKVGQRRAVLRSAAARVSTGLSRLRAAARRVRVRAGRR